MIIRKAEKLEELEGILSLQKANLKGNISVEKSSQEGFVSVQHNLELLAQMQEVQGHIVAIKNKEVIAYALSMSRTLDRSIPMLIPMFQILDQLNYQGRQLCESNYYIMGQICIQEDFRRQGLFKQLYQKHKEFYSHLYDYCITEVSTSNKRSFKAHQNVGFQKIHSFTDDTDDWEIILWDWS